MKRIILSLFALSLCLSITANDDPHLKRLIQCVNDSDFNCALEELPLVGDWTYDESLYHLSTDTTLSFIGYIKANSKLSAVDSLIYYYSVELTQIGLLQKKTGKYEAAEKNLLYALELRKSSTGINNLDYANSLLYLGNLYFAASKYQKAESYYIQVLSIRSSILGRLHYDCVNPINMLGMIHHTMGDYTKAEQYYLEAAEIIRKTRGEEDSAYATLIGNIGALYNAMGDIKKSAEYLSYATKLNKYSNGTLLTNLGLIYCELDSVETAEYYMLLGLEIRKNKYGESSLDVAHSLNSLGTLYIHKEDYKKAEECLIRALDIRKNINGELSKDYAQSLENIGEFFKRIGEYDKANKYLQQALSINYSLFGEMHPNCASILNHMGLMYGEMGNYSKSIEYLSKALEIRKEILGENHPEYAKSLNNLGIVYIRMKNYNQAEILIEKAASVYQHIYGTQHYTYGVSLESLGEIYAKTNRPDLAENYLLQSLDVLSNFKTEHPWFYNNHLVVLYRFYHNTHKYAEGVKYLTEISRLQTQNFISSMDFMTNQQRIAFWKTTKYIFEQDLPEYFYQYYVANHSSSTFAYDNELFTKGLLLNSSNTITNSILDSNDTTLIRQWNNLKTKKQQIMVLEEKEPKSDYLSQLRDEAEAIEKAITRNSTAYRENMRQWNITWDSVRAVLKPNQVAIEYMRAPLNEDSTMYCALLLRDTCTYPILIPLFEEKEVSSLLDSSDPSLIDKAYLYEQNGKQLSQLIWGKVLPYIHPGEIIFFAPTGLLHQVAVESLPYDSARTITDVYNTVRLSSTREIVLNKPSIALKQATLYGGILYDVSTDVLAAESSLYPEFAHRALSYDTLNRSMANYLPGTKIEVEQIQERLTNRRIKVHTYTESSANEESFKALSGTHQNILHIATHGFYWPNSTAQKEQYFSQRTATSDNIDPLDRCGLLFAGANIALSGYSDQLPEGVQDGILTAKEISTMDLRDADIVVLSACETAKGDISGEGVFGLQRAFKMAGAQSMLMAIWPVNDAATQMLMTAFYRYYCKGLSKREAFRKAQQEVRNYTVTKTETYTIEPSQQQIMENQGKIVPSKTVTKTITEHPYQSPYFWAGFILLD